MARKPKKQFSSAQALFDAALDTANAHHYKVCLTLDVRRRIALSVVAQWLTMQDLGHVANSVATCIGVIDQINAHFAEKEQ